MPYQFHIDWFVAWAVTVEFMVVDGRCSLQHKSELTLKCQC